MRDPLKFVPRRETESLLILLGREYDLTLLQLGRHPRVVSPARLGVSL